jgi:hypothetical protein
MRLAAARTGPPGDPRPRRLRLHRLRAATITELTDQPSVTRSWAAGVRFRAPARRPRPRGIPFVALSPLASPDVGPRPHALHRLAALGRPQRVSPARISGRSLPESYVLRGATRARSSRMPSCARFSERGAGSLDGRADAEGAIAVPGDGASTSCGTRPGLAARASRGRRADRARCVVLVAEGWAWDALDALAAGGARIHVVTWYSAADPDPRSRQFIEACNTAGIVRPRRTPSVGTS